MTRVCIWAVGLLGSAACATAPADPEPRREGCGRPVASLDGSVEQLLPGPRQLYWVERRGAVRTLFHFSEDRGNERVRSVTSSVFRVLDVGGALVAADDSGIYQSKKGSHIWRRVTSDLASAVSSNGEWVYWVSRKRRIMGRQLAATEETETVSVALSDGDKGIATLAVGETHLYWAAGNTVMGTPLLGGQPGPVWEAEAVVTALVPHGPHLFALVERDVYLVSLETREARLMAHAPNGFSLHGESLYWADPLVSRMAYAGAQEGQDLGLSADRLAASEDSLYVVADDEILSFDTHLCFP